MASIQRRNRELIGEFLTYKRDVKGLTDKTLETYARDYEDFLAQIGDLMPLANVTERDIVTFITRPMIQKRPGKVVGTEPSPKTVEKRASELRTLFGWLVLRGRVPSDPCRELELRKSEYGAVEPFPEDVWVDLWASDLTPEDRVAFGLWTFCGLRRAESTRMKTSSLRGAELVEFWRKGDRRGQASRGHSPWLTNLRLFKKYRPDLLPDVGVFTSALNQVMDKRMPLLVSGWADEVRRRSRTVTHAHVDERHANSRLRRALQACGHDIYAAHPHQGRHTFGTVMANDVHMQLQDLATLMNHSDLNSTRIYIKKDNDPGQRFLDDAESNDDLLAELSGRRAC